MIGLASIVAGERGHAALVAENAASGHGRGRIDGEDSGTASSLEETHAEGFDQSALADAGNPRDADAHRLPRRRQQLSQDLLREANVVVAPALDEGERLREDRTVATSDAVDIPRGRATPPVSSGHDVAPPVSDEEPLASVASFSRRSSTTPAASAMTVPGPKIADAPARKTSS